MSEDTKYVVTDLINAVSDQEPGKFADIFANLVQDKMKMAVDNKKLDIAKTIFSDDSGKE